MSIIPVKDARMTQEYGRKGNYKKGYHTDIDLVAGEADKYVYSVGPGQVIRARYAPGKGADPQGWGNYIIIRQDDGHDVLYAHLALVNVAEGEKVSGGQKIGLQGSTGNSTGPHLHFEVWKGSWEERQDINPAEYLGIVNQVGKVQQVTLFPDVPPDHWAAMAVTRVVEAGIMGGHPDGRFHGRSFCTRYELASALDRMLQLVRGGDAQ